MFLRPLWALGCFFEYPNWFAELQFQVTLLFTLFNTCRLFNVVSLSDDIIGDANTENSQEEGRSKKDRERKVVGFLIHKLHWLLRNIV